MDDKFLQDEINKLVNNSTIITGFYNGNYFIRDDNKKQISNLITTNTIPCGGFVIKEPNSGKWLFIAATQTSENNRLINNKRNRLKPEETNYLVKSIFNKLNPAPGETTYDLYIGGYIPYKNIIKAIQNKLNYILNKGGLKYLFYAVIKETNPFTLFHKTNKTTLKTITKSNNNGDNFYLGNDLWENDSNIVGARSIILNDKEKIYNITNIGNTKRTTTFLTEDDDGYIERQSYESDKQYYQPENDPLEVRNPLGILVSAEYGTFSSWYDVTQSIYDNDTFYPRYASYPLEVGGVLGIRSLRTFSYNTTITNVENIENEQVKLTITTQITQKKEQLYTLNVKEIQTFPINTVFGIVYDTVYVTRWEANQSRENYPNPNKNYTTAIQASRYTISVTETFEGENPNTYTEEDQYVELGIRVSRTIREMSGNQEVKRNIRYNDMYRSLSIYDSTVNFSPPTLQISGNANKTYTDYLPAGEGGANPQPVPVTYTDIKYLKQQFIPFIAEPIPPPPERLKEVTSNLKYNGTFIAIKTLDGYIKQTINTYLKARTVYYPTSSNTYTLETNTNTLSYLYSDKNINLNLSNFLILSQYSFINTISFNSTSFSISADINSDYSYFASPLSYLTNLIGNNYLLNRSIQNIPCLIKGSITNIEVLNNSNQGTLKFTFNIESITRNIKTSFFNKIITNNGSFYSYVFRKRNNNLTDYTFYRLYGTVFYKYNIIFNPISNSVDLDGIYNNTLKNVLINDNIIKNKIYSVVNIVKNIAYIEQWDILDNGNVVFKKVFKTNYISIPNNINNTSHSFNPK